MTNVIEILVTAKNVAKPAMAAAERDLTASANRAALAVEQANAKAAATIQRVNAEAAASIERANAQAADALMRNSEAAAAGSEKAAAAIERANAKASASIERTNAKAASAIERANAGAAASIERTNAQAAASVERTNARAAAASARASEKMRATVGKASAVAVTAVAAIGYETIKMASTFQAEMAKLNTQAGVPKAALAGLSKGVLALAGKIGADPDSLAESLYHVESNFKSMGISSAGALKLVETAAKGAKVGGADLVDVTNALTAAVAANIPGVKNLDQAMGYLNATVGAGDMSMQDLADAFGQGNIASVKGYGLSIRDVGAALAVFGDNNLRGAAAGTALRMSVQSLAVPAKAGKDVLKALGLQSNTLAKDMQTGGLLKAMTDLKTHMDAAGVSAVQQGQVITAVFGKKAGTGLTMLMGEFDRLQSKYGELDEGAHKFGTSWAETQKTTKQHLDQMNGSFQALMITVGTKLLPTVNKIADAFSKFMEKLNKDPALLDAVLVAVGALTVGFAALAVVMLANPISLVIVAVAALAAGLMYLWKTSQTAREVMTTVFAGISDVVLGNALIMIKGMHLLYDGVMRAVEGILRAFASIPGPTQKAAKAALSHFMDFKKGVDSTFDNVEGTLQSYKDSVDKLPKKIKLEGDIADLKTKITTAKASLATVPAMDRVFVNANISQLQSQVGKAKSALASVRGKTVYLDLVTRRGTTSSDHDSTIIGHASGGITGSGYSLVGEHGPEVVQLAPGSKVSTAGDTSRMLSASSMSPALQRALNGSSGSSSSSASAARREASAAKAAENRRVAAAKRLTAIYEQIGRDIGRSFEKGIRGTRDDVMRVMDTLLTEVEKSGSKTAERIVRATRGTMLKIAAQRDSLNAALSKAQDKLSNVKGVVNNQRASYEGDADITSGGTGTSYYSLLGNLQNTALHAKQFASKLGQLRKMGLGKTAQQQLLAADPATADQVASSILARGAGGVKEINALQAQISGSARAVGNVGASLAYGATQAQATAAVNNLHAGITKLDKTMAKLAAHMEGVLKQQIKAHAGHAAGGITGSGLVMVGEHGRELVRLSPGSRVYSNGATEGMLSAGGGSGRVTLEVHSGGSRMDDLIVEIIRKSVRVKGGNVQRVLGAR